MATPNFLDLLTLKASNLSALGNAQGAEPMIDRKAL